MTEKYGQLGNFQRLHVDRHSDSHLNIFVLSYDSLLLYFHSFHQTISFVLFSLSPRYKVHVTKPSTVSKLKANFVSLLPEDAQPQLEDIEVSVVRNSQIVSIMVQKKTFLLTALSTFNTFCAICFRKPFRV